MIDVEAVFAGARTLGIIAKEDLMIVAEKRDDVWVPEYVLSLAHHRLVPLADVDADAVVEAAAGLLDKSVALKVRIGEAVTDIRRPR